jgi:hypothetical protein
LAPWEQLEKEEIKKKKGKITKSFDTHRPSHGRHYPAAAWVTTGEKGDLSPGIGGWLHQQSFRVYREQSPRTASSSATY